jgi:hypothetical protein
MNFGSIFSFTGFFFTDFLCYRQEFESPPAHSRRACLPHSNVRSKAKTVPNEHSVCHNSRAASALPGGLQRNEIAEQMRGACQRRA